MRTLHFVGVRFMSLELHNTREKCLGVSLITSALSTMKYINL